MAKTIKTQKRWIRALQFFAAYLVAAWTLLQFIDWIVNRYQFSTYWTDMCLWLFVGIIPSVLLYLFNMDRINKRILSLREKIFFPANIILLIISLFIFFGSKDLSAKTSNLSFTDDDGNEESMQVLKEKYRTSIPVFNFEQEIVDSSSFWINWAIPDLLFEDMAQDGNVNPLSLMASSTSEKIEETKSLGDFYVDGSYSITDETYSISPTIRNSSNGKLIASNTFVGNDFLEILDSISIYLRDVTGIDEKKRDLYPDLPLKEHLSFDMKAIKFYVLAINKNPVNFQHATEVDSTFAMAYKSLADFLLYWNIGLKESQILYDKAYKFRKKLPYNQQFEIMLYRHMAYEEWDKAEQMAKLQLKVTPKNLQFQRALHIIYAQTGRMKAKFEFSKINYSLDPLNWNMLCEDFLFMGKYDKAIELIQEVSLDENEKLPYLIKPLLLKGDLEAASNTIEKFN
ncbi:MAG: hypothetical protein KJO77_08180, partial [Bacteroidia bacterium]|nr:hypothetical protein [Bacteroidia bacterium]